MSVAFSITLKKGAFLLKAEGEIQANAVTALIGRSGAGKTTLLRCLAGLEPKAKGPITFEGEPWQTDGNTQFTQPEKRHIGYVFQKGELFPNLSVSQNIEYARKRARRSPTLSYERIISATGVEPLLGRDIGALSGGEGQRVAIARALCSNPQLLLLDEPLSALDHESRQELLSCLKELPSAIKIPILIVTHNLADAAQLATHAIKMEAGSIVAAGPVEEVLPSSYELDQEHREPFTLLDSTVLAYDGPYSLARLDSPIGSLLAPTRTYSPNTRVKITIHARDVSLSLHPPEAVSLLNILHARVTATRAFDNGRTLVTLSCGNATLQSLITKKSEHALGIEKDLACYCLIKSVSLVP